MRKLLLIVVLFGLADVILTAMPEGPLRERREIQELALMSPNALGAVPAPPTAQLLMRIQKRSQPEEQDRLRRTPKPTSIPVTLVPLKGGQTPPNRRAPKPTSIIRIVTVTTPVPRIRRAPKPRSIPVIIGNITAPRNRRAPKPTSIVRIAIATTPKPKRIRRAPKPTSIVRIAIATTPKPKRIRRAPKPTSIVRIAIATTPKPKRVRRDFDIPASTAPVRAGRSALSAILEPRIRRNPKPPRSRRTPAPTSRPKTCCRV
ncbi:hypothetical protein Ddc_17475 [Ditylenchus destructor]|nr:hypothetical protein Ddc_17475 [Ditylenchus destructor]